MPKRTRGSLARSRRPDPAAARGLVIRATLQDITPTIWREVVVPEHHSLAQLHRVLQLAFGWLDCHLYLFTVGRLQYADPSAGLDALDATRTTLGALALSARSTLTYVYDFGDDWQHALVVRRLVQYAPDDDPLPALLDGARAGPPEDAGGPPGYEQLLAARSDPRHPEHHDAMRWLGSTYDPDAFDLRSAANALTLAAAWGAI